MRRVGSPGRGIRLARALLLLSSAASTALLLLCVSPAAVDPPRDPASLFSAAAGGPSPGSPADLFVQKEAEVEDAVEEEEGGGRRRTCATVEEMGRALRLGSEKESLRVREVIKRHFDLHGAARVRGLPPQKFCRQGFVIGKASEAGLGNEMYKILTAAALSVMLNRSLIIGQTRGFYPFGEYISYSNISFTLREVKHLWRQNDCAGKYRRNLVMRVDSFEQPTETSVLCSDWRVWKQPIIWFQGTTDAVAIQFFLKNIHPGMKDAASILFGRPESMQPRPNVFGELMRVIMSPTQQVKEAVDWVLKGADPDVSLHMRMLTNRSVRAIQAALRCVKRALDGYHDHTSRPRIVLVSDTPSFVRDIMPDLTQFAEVLHFNYNLFEGKISNGSLSRQHQSMDFRVKDWGPAPRWVAFVDFFLASRAKHVVVSGAHRRVGTTYAQLIAALAAANQLGGASNSSTFSFFSSFQSNLLINGLRSQVGWGHIWNRFAGPLSCQNQPHQCARTPLLPSAWWDGEWQSPIPRDIQRLQSYGVHLTDSGDVIESTLQSHCRSRKYRVKIMPVFGQCKSTKCS